MIPISQPSQPTPQGLPVFRLGFRPFYLGTALLACLSVPLWIALFLGRIPADAINLPLPPLYWHAHEMLFGFAAGVIGGFLLTAVKAWTGVQTPRGTFLGFIFLSWLGARLAVFVLPYWAFAAIDMLFLPITAGALLQVLLKANNRRNIPLISLLLLMTLANGAFHLAILEVLPISPVTPLYAELSIIIMVITIMTGRVVPMFTRNVTPGLMNTVPERLESSVKAVTALTLILWVVGAPALLVAMVSAIAALLHGTRLWIWNPFVTLKRPILWILHLAYLWMPIGFALLALAQFGVVTVSIAVHALAVGVIGGLIIGMITRTARGHTGRMLQTGRSETIAYALVLLATVLRVVIPAAIPSWYFYALEVAACLWAIAFAIYLFIYTPWLLRTRLDGKDG